METLDISDLKRSENNKLKVTNDLFHRYNFHQIDWEDRLIGIQGPRGCGKTTLLLQHLKEDFADREKVLYASLDHLWFSTHTLIELADYHYAHGGTHLLLDEVHHYPTWQQELKNIYDDFPEMKVVYTGSSMLQIDYAGADLSRRKITYNMAGMSFREFLQYEKIIDIQPLDLPTLLQQHQQIAEPICSQTKILPLFETYLQHGYYPFYKEVKRGFEQRLQATISQVLESDYPAIDEVTINTIRKTRKMLMIIAEHVPQIPTMNDLYRELETDRNQGLKMLSALERAGLILLLTNEAKSLKTMSKPDKIYLHNTNLMYALTPNRVDIGNMRETFFFNQLQQAHEVFSAPKGDFLVDKKYLFEVGGKHKTFDQIKDIPNSFLAVADTEIGYHNRIPLWMFGLLY